MATERRARSDSTTSAIQAFKDARQRIEWPLLEVSPMPRAEDQERAQSIFDKIISSRAIADWRLHDPVLVAQLAVVQIELDKIMLQIGVEGWTVLGGKHGTTPVRSPLMDPAQHLSSRALSLSRALGITGEPADMKTIAKNARTAAEARAVARDQDEDGVGALLA